MKDQNLIKLDIGNLTGEDLNQILDIIPFDITFIDKNDRVKYFNKIETRIFKRPASVIGKEVQKCHPEKSLYKVQEILDDFKAKKRKMAEFWINLEGIMVYIRYFPVYNNNEEYLGCLEVSQDITDIKKIEGEKRLL